MSRCDYFCYQLRLSSASTYITPVALQKRSPCFETIRQTAWEVAVLLIEHTDFTLSEADRPVSADFELTAEPNGYELLPHVASGIASFSVCVETLSHLRSSSTTLFFRRISREEASLRLTAVFNPLAYPSLRQLQKGIQLLRTHGSDLTNESLTLIMRELTPDTSFNLLITR